MNSLLSFLEELEKRKIYYRLNKIRDSVLVEIAVPGERWEVEFFNDEHVEIEKFVSCGKIYDRDEIDNLFNQFSD